MNAAAMRAYAGTYESALPLVRRSYELRRAAFGDDHADLAFPLTLMGQVLIALDRPAEAREPLTRALELMEPALGPTAHMVRDAHVALAEALLLDGRPQAALLQARTAEAALPDAIDPGHPSRLYLLRVTGTVRRQAGDLDGALARHEELLALIGPTASDTANDTAESLWAIARTLAAAGRIDEARPLLERALRSVRERDRWLAASIRASLAEAVARDDPERARRLVAEARDRLSPTLPLHRELLRALDGRWGASEAKLHRESAGPGR
jgi:tetratricopeptide (TPR) repeat protein